MGWVDCRGRGCRSGGGGQGCGRAGARVAYSCWEGWGTGVGGWKAALLSGLR